jgi:hypothetical protein
MMPILTTDFPQILKKQQVEQLWIYCSQNSDNNTTWPTTGSWNSANSRKWKASSARMYIYFKGCECNKETFYTYVLQDFIYDREIIAPVST